MSAFRIATLAVALAGSLVALPVSAQGLGPGDIPAGVDCWSTPCGRTQVAFCRDPIPAGFFGPGSEPFDGAVALGGDPSLAHDTAVARLADISLPRRGDAQVVPIEMVELHLVSCQPIVVRQDGVDAPWDVSVDLSSVVPPPGQMRVRKTHDNGGTFDASLPVLLRFTFTSRDEPPQIRQLDLGALGRSPEVLVTLGDVSWVHVAAAGLGQSACGVNFVPGLRETPKGREAGAQCAVVACRAGASITQCAVGDPGWPGCREGACCSTRGRCSVLSAGRTESAGQRCAARGGTYAGDGTTCSDLDGDGIPDAHESNDCCGARDACHTGTNPANPDTDGDGADDGLELKAGTDPCDPASHP